MEFHPIASIFPLLEGDELQALADDIKANGLHDPVWLYEGKVLDGRNRARACEMADVPLQTRDFTGDRASALRYVWSENFHRRHLDSSQRAACFELQRRMNAEFAAEVEKVKEEAKERQTEGGKKAGRGRPQQVSQQIDEAIEHRTDSVLADVAGTNRTYLAAAAKLDTPALEAIRDGQQTMTDVMRQAKEEKREAKRQTDIIRVAGLDTIPQLLAANAAFQTIVLDPPWDWGDEGDCDQLGRARPTYATMPLEQLANLPVGELADKDCHLYLWITNRSLPKGFGLLDAWGFRYITLVTWCKPHFGMGNYFRGQTEHVLFGVKGSLLLLRKDVGTWFAAPRGPLGHSSKPEDFYAMAESCSPAPRLEMFSRAKREGWTCCE